VRRWEKTIGITRQAPGAEHTTLHRRTQRDEVSVGEMWKATSESANVLAGKISLRRKGAPFILCFAAKCFLPGLPDPMPVKSRFPRGGLPLHSSNRFSAKASLGSTGVKSQSVCRGIAVRD
jgi:hypothetical protein